MSRFLCYKCRFNEFCRRANRRNCMVLMQLTLVAAGMVMMLLWLVLGSKTVVEVTSAIKLFALAFLLYALYVVVLISKYMHRYVSEVLK